MNHSVYYCIDWKSDRREEFTTWPRNQFVTYKLPVFILLRVYVLYTLAVYHRPTYTILLYAVCIIEETLLNDHNTGMPNVSVTR